MSPRIQRCFSPLDLYHVLINGNNNEDIFIDDQDKQAMVDILFEKSTNNAYDFYAYCILDNRANLLIRPKDAGLSESMKKINMAYAAYFNKKYSRSGHVFQDRFKSTPILCSTDIVSVIGYIHYNPVLEGLCGKPSEYGYSSYRYYADEKSRPPSVLAFVQSFNMNPDAVARYTFSSIGENFYYDDCFANMQQIAHRLIERFLQTNRILLNEIDARENAELRESLVILIRKNTGFSIRKISELLNINRGEVYRIINRLED
ncbi:MAG: transposase [Anaerofustis sp.]